MWSFEVYVIGFIIIFVTQWIYKWRNPKCEGKLPPGSSGIPLIGETLELFIPTNSYDVHPFIQKRLRRHGPLFRTNLAGRNVVVSADHEFNRYIFQQEEKLVIVWYLDSFAGLVKQGEVKPDNLTLHKYMRNLVLSHFGTESLKRKLSTQFEAIVRKAIHSWSTKDSVELQYAFQLVVGECCLNQLCGCDPDLSKEFMDVVSNMKVAFLFPLKIPGTAYYKSLKKKDKVLEKIKEMVNARLAAPQNVETNDLMGQMVKDLVSNDVYFVTKEYVNYQVYVVMFATIQTIPFTLAVAVKFLSENPAVLRELTAEHEEMVKKRKEQGLEGSLTWEEYKSMTYTQQVINETLRLGNTFPGFLRKAIKDIEVKGYTIPAGWGIMACHTSMHLDPEIYKDPLKFDPSRWKDIGAEFMSKNFKPFGGGIKQCAGADFTRVAMAIFFHVLLTKYRWSVVKGGDVTQKPVLVFKDALHINVREIRD